MIKASSKNPPQAKIAPQTFETHGVRRTDNYAWLRSKRWQEVMQNPKLLEADIRSYLEAENAYQESVMKPTKQLQEMLYSEMRGRIEEDDKSVPLPDGPYLYNKKFVTGGQYPHFTRCLRSGDDEFTILDGDQEAKGKSYFSFGGAKHSPSHNLFYWSIDDTGSEYYSIAIRDAKTLLDHKYRIERTNGDFIFSADETYGFYVQLDKNHRPSKVFRHKIGTDPENDVLVFEEKDAGFFVGIDKTLSGTTILIEIVSHHCSEIWTIPADQPLSDPKIVAERENEVKYSVSEHCDTFYILTNYKNAEDFSIFTAPKKAPNKKNWTVLVAHKPGCLIQSSFVVKNYLLRKQIEDGLSSIIILDLIKNSEQIIKFEEDVYSIDTNEGFEFDTTVIRFSYSSMKTPRQVFDYNLATGKRFLKKEQKIPSGHNAKNYITRRTFAQADDGELIPVSLLYRKDIMLDGTAPCLLYGYGSYGITIPTSFNSNALSLVDRGFVYAIAHVRGGREKGYRWYKEGRREHKTNTFKDFIAVADHLAAENYTSYSQLIAQGGSAGGMLMGAIANMAPTKFAGIIAQVPFVDVLNTILDETLPLTPPEWLEWGNPIKDKKAYDLISAYSPYDNVKPNKYPAIFALGGLADPRVTYWEPAKWVAKLRKIKTDNNILILKTNMEAGHAGASGRFNYLKEIALIQAFALMTVAS